MAAIKKQPVEDTGKVNKGILSCRKLIASQRQMHEEAEKDWYVPKIQAIIQEQKSILRDEALQSR